FPQVSSLLRLLDCLTNVAHSHRVFRTDVEEAVLRADRVRRNRQTLHYAMRVRFEHRAIHERARVPFISVADDVLVLVGLRWPERPFSAGGEPGPAAAAQARQADRVNN